MNKKNLLCLIFVLVFNSGCGLLLKSILEVSNSFNNSSIFRQGQHSELTKEETDLTKVAWKYFENNNSESGIPPTIDRGSFFSSWDISCYLSALISANKLEILSNSQFDERISRFLYFLNTMPLYKNELPNKFYSLDGRNILNAQYKNGEAGVSFADIGRLLIWLRILKTNYPNYAEYVDKAVLRWNFCSLIYEGKKTNTYTKFYNDSFFTENYAKKGYDLWGFQVKDVYTYNDLSPRKINGITIMYDRNNLLTTKNTDAVYSYPYILEGLEFNWDNLNDNNNLDSAHTDKDLFAMSENIYKVQEKRFLTEGIFTAKDFYILNKEPYYIYDTIFAEGYNWNTVTYKGGFNSSLALVSSKASLGMWSLWNTDYTQKLFDLVSSLYDPQRGWYEGRYEKNASIEKTISLATNSLVLEAFFYKKNGKIYLESKKEGYYEFALKNEFNSYNRACFPTKDNLEKFK